MTGCADTAGQRGSAIAGVMGAIFLLSAVGLGLVLLSMSETMAAGNTSRATSVLYSAQAGLERVLTDLAHLPDWDRVLDGGVASGFVDGPSSGSRVLADGRTLNLDDVVNLANCGAVTRCSDAQMESVSAERPWGPNNPRWRLFAHGPLADLAVPVGFPLDDYVVVLVADDPAETDGNPLRDGRPATGGAGVIVLRAEAFGPEGAHRVVEAVVARGAPGSGVAGYAAQHGEGRTADGATANVQVPGGALTRLEMSLSGGLIRQ